MNDNSPTTDPELVRALLDEGVMRDVLEKLGISNEAAEVQTELIGNIGQLALKRVILEVFKKVPEEEHEMLESLIGSGDAASMRDIMEAHIPNLDEFIAETIRKEIEATLALANITS
jgi:hypothetical protein